MVVLNVAGFSQDGGTHSDSPSSNPNSQGSMWTVRIHVAASGLGGEYDC